MAGWWRSLLVLCILSLMVLTKSAVRAYRVTLIPLPETSHCRQMVSVGRQLVSRGHQVLLYVPSYFKVRRCTEPAPAADVEVRLFAVAPAVAEMLGSLDSVMEAVRGGTEAARPLARPVGDVIGHVCASYVEAREELESLRKQRADLILLDSHPAARCLALLPAFLGVPFGLLGGVISPLDSGGPLPVNYYPAPDSALTGSMSFTHRLSNLLHYASQAWSDIFLERSFRQGDALGAKFSAVDYGGLFRKAVVFLEDSDYIVDHPKAVFPNFVQVGGLSASPAKPLPGPLLRFFDGADDKGVVIASFGSQLLNPTPQVEEKLLLAFKHVDARVLLRLNVSASANRLRNVLVTSWFPQNDALGHANVRLFVSQCGKNGFFEALYHGVPLLCTPFHSDTLGTSARVQEFGVGHMLDFQHASADKISSTINSMLADKGLLKRMKMASSLFKNRPQTPSERAAGAIERVIKYGGVHLRPRSIELNFFQHAGLDVAFTVFMFAAGVLLAVAVTARQGVRYLLGVVTSSAQSPTKPPAHARHETEAAGHDAAEVSVHHTTDGQSRGAPKPQANARHKQTHAMTAQFSEETRQKIVCVILLVAIALFYYFA